MIQVKRFRKAGISYYHIYLEGKLKTEIAGYRNLLKYLEENHGHFNTVFR
jgi:hypothetical protein